MTDDLNFFVVVQSVRQYVNVSVVAAAENGSLWIFYCSNFLDLWTLLQNSKYNKDAQHHRSIDSI